MINIENYRIKKKMGSSLRRFVRGNLINLNDACSNPVIQYVGLSRTDFREYLEYQFLEGMSWGNYCSEWVIDHIAPLPLFNLHKETDLCLCWGFLNMMPMWKSQNKIKGDSLDFAKIELLRRIEAAPSSVALQQLLDKITVEESHHSQYQYPLDFLRFYTKVNYHNGSD